MLPSALEAFADVSGPPDFLRHRVAEPEEGTEALGVLDRRGKEGSKQPPPESGCNFSFEFPRYLMVKLDQELGRGKFDVLCIIPLHVE
uniref:Uncharacterized protein n=1 Tax=Zea mays TaxID=4577 RepID=A0A804MLN6_MAIZE